MWKQVLGSIFSWQTVLVLGIILLVTYGKEIGNWVSSLFNSGKALDENIEKLDEFHKKVSDGVGKSIASVNRLAIVYSALGNNMDEKKRFIDENKSAFDSLGVSVNSVRDAKKLLIENKETFIESLRFRAKATAAYELAMERYKKGEEKILENKTTPQALTFGEIHGNPIGKSKLQIESEQLSKSGDNFMIKYGEFTKHEADLLNGLNIQTQEIIAADSVAAIEKCITEKQKVLKKLTNKADYDAAVVEIKAEEKKLEAIIGNKGDAPKKVENNDIVGKFKIKFREPIPVI